MFALHDDLDTIAGIHAPTLLICGGRTRKPARRVMEKIRSALPETHYIEIADAGHMSPSLASNGGGGCDSGPHRLRSSPASPGGMTRNAASALKSALGQKQTFAVQKGMSALPPESGHSSAASKGLLKCHQQTFSWRRVRPVPRAALVQALAPSQPKNSTLRPSACGTIGGISLQSRVPVQGNVWTCPLKVRERSGLWHSALYDNSQGPVRINVRPRRG